LLIQKKRHFAHEQGDVSYKVAHTTQHDQDKCASICLHIGQGKCGSNMYYFKILGFARSSPEHMVPQKI
jgi:hypothetical protein